MLTKLLKYDLKREYKSLIPIYGIALLIPILIRVLNFVTEKVPFFASVRDVVVVVYFMLLIGIFFITFFNSIRNFVTNVLKDEGYLTHTLPIKRNHIIISKEITSMVTILSSVIVIILSTILAFYDGSSLIPLFETLGKGVESLAPLYGMGEVELWVFALSFIVLGYFGYIITFHLALILGHTRNTNRIVFSIVFGIIIYVILQILSLLGLGLDILLQPSLISDMDAMIVNPQDIASTMKLVTYTQAFITLVSMIATHFISCIALNKKLNLE